MRFRSFWHRRPSWALSSILVAFASPCFADTVYKCVGSDATPRFQDHPCRADDREEIVPILPPPTPPVTDVPADAPTFDTAPAAPTAAVASDGAPRPPPPVLYDCVRYDGSHYVSENGAPQQAAVPLGVLGVPSASLAEAYGGPNGIGVSAPGLRTPPVERGGRNGVAGGYVWTQDSCRPLPTFDTCLRLRADLRETERKLRRAFKDQTPALERDARSLRERLSGC